MDHPVGAGSQRGDRVDFDLTQQKMGDKDLQGDDQANVHNQRHAVPDVKQGTDSIMESLEKSGKNVRAKRDLGKGRRYSENHPYNLGDGSGDKNVDKAGYRNAQSGMV